MSFGIAGYGALLQVMFEGSGHEGLPRVCAPTARAVQDIPATERLFQPSFCRVDWRLFDPGTLSWRFDGEAYVERLKGLKA